jgi:hypothetical protein
MYGTTRSCGCLRDEATQERRRLLAEANVWGVEKTPTYWSWRAICSLCHAVPVHPRWLGLPEGFARFVRDMGERPDGTTLGRFADEGDYEPGNVAWMTPDEQQEQRRLKRERRKELAA